MRQSAENAGDFSIRKIRRLSKIWLNSPSVLKLKKKIEEGGEKVLKQLGFTKLRRKIIDYHPPNNFDPKPTKYQWGGTATVWKKGRIVVKKNPMIVCCPLEVPKRSCPTIVIEKDRDFFYIQPLVSLSKYKTASSWKLIDASHVLDTHFANWGYWKGIPVFFDW